MDDFAGRLRTLMAKRGLGVLAVARRVPCDKSLISRLASGKTNPSEKIGRRLDDVLEAGGELASLAGSGSGLALGGERVTWTLRHPRRVDREAVDCLAGVLAAQRRAEDALGASLMLAPVKAQLAAIEGLVIEARGTMRPFIVGMAGQWAQYAGWLHASTKQEVAASRLYDRALEWAVEAADVNLMSEIISMKGHIAWMAGHPGPVIGLSQAAQRDPGVFPGQHAISAAQEARGHAMVGDTAEAERKLAHALAKAQAAQERRDEAPPWLYYHSPAFFDLQRGLVYRFLARDPGYYEQAVTALRAGRAGLPANEQASDWGAVFLFHLAAVHGQAGNVDEASAVALDVAAIARRTGSVRLVKMLIPLRTSLARRFPAHAGAAALGEALR
jgi:transcriptional regulator with XRE-family HTH domain